MLLLKIQRKVFDIMRETLSYSYTIMTEGEKLDKIKDAIDDTAVVKATKKYK